MIFPKMITITITIIITITKKLDLLYFPPLTSTLEEDSGSGSGSGGRTNSFGDGGLTCVLGNQPGWQCW